MSNILNAFFASVFPTENRECIPGSVLGEDSGDSFLPARRYASAGLCDSDVSVRPSVCPPRAGIVPSRAKAGS